jgi:hypothetical protein
MILVSILEHTMIRSNQFIVTMVRLAALDSLLAVHRSIRQFIGPVHPINACIDVVLIGSTDLEDARDPVVITLLVNTLAITLSFLLFNGYLVGNIDKAFTVILDTVDCQELAISPYNGRRQDFIGYLRTKLL